MHFFFIIPDNTLSVLSHLMRSEKYDKSVDIFLVDLLSTGLHWSQRGDASGRDGRWE